MVDVRDNNGPFEIEPKPNNSFEIKGPIGEIQISIPMDTNEKNILNAFLEKLIIDLFDRKIYQVINRIYQYTQGNQIDHAVLMKANDEDTKKEKKNYQEGLRSRLGGFDVNDINSNVDNLRREYRNIQNKLCKGNRCDTYLVKYIQKLPFNYFIQKTPEFDSLTQKIKFLKNIFYGSSQSVSTGVSQAKDNLSLNISSISQLLNLYDEFSIMISGFIGVNIERSQRSTSHFPFGATYVQPIGDIFGGGEENEKESDISQEGGFYNMQNIGFSNNKDIRPWKGTLKILGLDKIINRIDDLDGEFYLAIIDSFHLKSWNKNHPSKTASEINLRGATSEGGIERSAGNLKIYDSTIFGNVENSISSEPQIQPFLVPPTETLANIFSKNENNYFKGLAEINNSLQSGKKFDDYFKDESTWPPYLEDDLVILQIIVGRSNKKLCRIYHLNDVITTTSNKLEIKSQYHKSRISNIEIDNIENISKGIKALNDLYGRNRLYKYFPNRAGATKDDPCVVLNVSGRQLPQSSVNTKDEVGEWIKDAAKSYNLNIVAKLLVVLIISSRWVRPSLLTKDFLEKESDILKSHTNILSLITHLEELESSAKRCWNNIEGDNSPCQIKGIKTNPAGTSGSLGMDGVMFPCVLPCTSHVPGKCKCIGKPNDNVLQREGGFLITKISSNSPQGKYKWWKAKDFKSEKNDLQKACQSYVETFLGSPEMYGLFPAAGKDVQMPRIDGLLKPKKQEKTIFSRPCPQDIKSCDPRKGDVIVSVDGKSLLLEKRNISENKEFEKEAKESLEKIPPVQINVERNKKEEEKSLNSKKIFEEKNKILNQQPNQNYVDPFKQLGYQQQQPQNYQPAYKQYQAQLIPQAVPQVVPQVIPQTIQQPFQNYYTGGGRIGRVSRDEFKQIVKGAAGEPITFKILRREEDLGYEIGAKNQERERLSKLGWKFNTPDPRSPSKRYGMSKNITLFRTMRGGLYPPGDEFRSYRESVGDLLMNLRKSRSELNTYIKPNPNSKHDTPWETNNWINTIVRETHLYLRYITNRNDASEEYKKLFKVLTTSVCLLPLTGWDGSFIPIVNPAPNTWEAKSTGSVVGTRAMQYQIEGVKREMKNVQPVEMKDPPKKQKTFLEILFGKKNKKVKKGGAEQTTELDENNQMGGAARKLIYDPHTTWLINSINFLSIDNQSRPFTETLKNISSICENLTRISTADIERFYGITTGDILSSTYAPPHLIPGSTIHSRLSENITGMTSNLNNSPLSATSAQGAINQQQVIAQPSVQPQVQKPVGTFTIPLFATPKQPVATTRPVVSPSEIFPNPQVQSVNLTKNQKLGGGFFSFIKNVLKDGPTETIKRNIPKPSNIIQNNLEKRNLQKMNKINQNMYVERHGKKLPPVQIFWIRHGASCSNLRKDSNIIPDPDITMASRDHASAVGLVLDKLNFKPDFVGCSSLTRAAQTAYFTFPDQEIHVLPYLREVRSKIPQALRLSSASNTALPPRIKLGAYLASKQGKKEEINSASTLCEELLYTIGEGVGNFNFESWWWDQNNLGSYKDSSFEKFLNIILPKLIASLIYCQDPNKKCKIPIAKPLEQGEKLEDNSYSQKPIKIAIVGHSSFMKSSINCVDSDGKKSINNAVYSTYLNNLYYTQNNDGIQVHGIDKSLSACNLCVFGN